MHILRLYFEPQASHACYMVLHKLLALFVCFWFVVLEETVIPSGFSLGTGTARFETFGVQRVLFRVGRIYWLVPPRCKFVQHDLRAV